VHLRSEVEVGAAAGHFKLRGSVGGVEAAGSIEGDRHVEAIGGNSGGQAVRSGLVTVDQDDCVATFGLQVAAAGGVSSRCSKQVGGAAFEHFHTDELLGA